MGRKAQSKRESKKQPAAVQPPLRSEINRPLLVLSIIGMALASYLSWTEWTGSQLKGCAVGSSCDIVLSSRWATLFGLPTAFWGLLAYATLAGTAFIKRVDWHWWAAWLIALFGVLYSAYLTTVSLTILGAACPYCLTSLVDDIDFRPRDLPTPCDAESFFVAAMAEQDGSGRPGDHRRPAPSLYWRDR